MAQVIWSASAKLWLREIYDYLAEDSQDAADRTIDGIYKKAKLLLQFPLLGYRFDKVPDRHIRILLFGHYRIAYIVQPDDSIAILGVYHGSLDIERHIDVP